MNASELAAKMLEWELKYRELDVLEQTIKSIVLEIGETQTVGNIRATYSKGRAKYDYETPGSQAEKEIIGLYSEVREQVNWEELARSYDPSDTVITNFTSIETIINWRNVCRAADIEPLTVSQGEPNVRVKLLE
jgi:hypothetical protein